MRRTPLLLLLVSLTPLAGCKTQSPATVSQSGRPKVVATFSVLGDFVQNVAGDKVELVTLVGPDGDAHTFNPAPADGAAIANANAIFEIGVGFEPWLDGMFKSSNSKATRFTVSKGLTLLQGQDEDKGKKDQKAKHDTEDKDPHIWHDVQNAKHMVVVIRDGLVQIDSANADHYKSKAAAYLKQLEDLDGWIKSQVATVPPKNRKLVTNHDTFGYFAKRYGFEILGDALGSVSTEAGDPSAQDFTKLCEAIKAAQVPAIFAENVQNSKLMERLAKETGVRLAPPLYSDALGKAGSAGETYEKMMRYNVTTIVTQLKQ
jgi:zinc/manganese transport system substrate-binding protein